MRLLRKRLRDLWRSLFWVDPHPGFNNEWLVEHGHPTFDRLDEPEFYELLGEYLAERAGEEARADPYR